MSELLKNAFTGVNTIPTTLLILTLLYWITVIIGAFDFFELNFDNLESPGIFHSVLTSLKISDLPMTFVISVLILNFWLIAMLIYYLPISIGGIVNGVLLIPALMLSFIITKYEVIALKWFFNHINQENSIGSEVIEKKCVLLSNMKEDQMGQAEIERDGASIVINVKTENQGQLFKKGEVAFVIRKDTDKNLYYIIKNEE